MARYDHGPPELAHTPMETAATITTQKNGRQNQHLPPRDKPSSQRG